MGRSLPVNQSLCIATFIGLASAALTAAKDAVAFIPDSFDLRRYLLSMRWRTFPAQPEYAASARGLRQLELRPSLRCSGRTATTLPPHQARRSVGHLPQVD